MQNTIYTIGHSNHSIERFLNLLKQHNISAIADVRSVPFSKFYPQFNKDTLTESLQRENIAYVFLGKELGGRSEDLSCYENGHLNFDKIAITSEFREGLQRILQGCKRYRISLMCAEKEPLDCHRTILICYHLKHLGLTIKHILIDGTIEDHIDTENRLLKLTNYEDDLFNRDIDILERLDLAYKKRSQNIAYEYSEKEAYE